MTEIIIAIAALVAFVAWLLGRKEPPVVFERKRPPGEPPKGRQHSEEQKMSEGKKPKVFRQKLGKGERQLLIQYVPIPAVRTLIVTRNPGCYGDEGMEIMLLFDDEIDALMEVIMEGNADEEIPS